ncbi:MAG: hypothetical protein RIT27_993 [Pseudomonadota bacterium]|jgi:hypothetical protein
MLEQTLGSRVRLKCSPTKRNAGLVRIFGSGAYNSDIM